MIYYHIALGAELPRDEITLLTFGFLVFILFSLHYFDIIVLTH